MLLTHTKAREDLNDGKDHTRTFSPLAVMQALRMAHGRTPIKSLNPFQFRASVRTTPSSRPAPARQG